MARRATADRRSHRARHRNYLNQPALGSLCWHLALLGHWQSRLHSLARATITQTLSVDTVRKALQPILSDPKVPKIGQNIKYDLIVLRQMEIDVRGIVMDTMVADYLVDPGQRDHSLDDLARRYLQHKTTKITELIGSGRDQLTMDQVAIDKITAYACQDVDVPFRLYDLLIAQLEELGLKQLFDSVEVPLVSVLADLEYNGIRVDVERLASMRSEFAARIERLHDEIVALAANPLTWILPNSCRSYSTTASSCLLSRKRKRVPAPMPKCFSNSLHSIHFPRNCLNTDS